MNMIFLLFLITTFARSEPSQSEPEEKLNNLISKISEKKFEDIKYLSSKELGSSIHHLTLALRIFQKSTPQKVEPSEIDRKKKEKKVPKRKINLKPIKDLRELGLTLTFLDENPGFYHSRVDIPQFEINLDGDSLSTSTEICEDFLNSFTIERLKKIKRIESTVHYQGKKKYSFFPIQESEKFKTSPKRNRKLCQTAIAKAVTLAANHYKVLPTNKLLLMVASYKARMFFSEGNSLQSLKKNCYENLEYHSGGHISTNSVKSIFIGYEKTIKLAPTEPSFKFEKTSSTTKLCDYAVENAAKALTE